MPPVSAMQNIIVRRYTDRSHGWQGWIEPEDKSWIAFIDAEGRPLFFLDRDPDTGAVLPAPPGVGSPGDGGASQTSP